MAATDTASAKAIVAFTIRAIAMIWRHIKHNANFPAPGAYGRMESNHIVTAFNKLQFS